MNWLNENPEGNPLVIMPTGTGKSVNIAEVAKLSIDYPQIRIIIATHSQELVAQNFQELIGLWNEAPAGVHSAGLGKHDVHQKILFVGIQSVYSKAFTLQRCDILIVDEAHSIPRESETMWGKFISDLKMINPHMRVIGFTATGYRMDSGSLTEGEGALFTAVAYEYEIIRAIQEGYLCPVIPKSMATKLSVKGVGKRNGEFIEKQLQEAVNVDEITKAAVDEIFLYGENRNSWLIFGSGVEHSTAIAKEITSRGVKCEVIIGATPKGERSSIIRTFRSGTLKALSNNKVLTTGFNAPIIDLIADMNPTMSAGLFVQKVGRGMRLHPDKDDCLLLDFANNLSTHGCIDQIKAKKPPEGDGVAPIKDCPGLLPADEHGEVKVCNTILHAAAMTCHVCGHKFPEPELKIAPLAANHAVLSTQVEKKHRRVMSISYNLHEKTGGTPSLRVDYMTEGFKRIPEWVCLQHKGGARSRAERWWQRRAKDDKILSTLPIPTDINAALGLVAGLKKPFEVVTTKAGKYDEIIGFVFKDDEPEPQAVVEKPREENHDEEQWTPKEGAVMDIDDEIPF